MSKKFLVIAAALAVALPALSVAPSAFAQAAPPTETVQVAPTLPRVSKENMTAEIFNSDKPVFVLVVGDNCDSCSGLSVRLAAQADKYPDWKFVQVTAADAGVPAEAVPLIAVLVPKSGTVYSKAAFAVPADLDAFIKARVDFGNKLSAANAKVADLEKQIAEKGKPFDDEMQVLQDQANVIVKPFTDRINAIKADAAKAVEPLNKELQDARDRQAAAAKPFIEQIEVVSAQLQKATAPLETEWDTLQTKLDDLNAKGVKADDPEYKTAADRAEALRKEYAEKSASFEKQIEELRGKARDARSGFNAELQGIRTKIQEANKPFGEKIQAVRAEINEALKDLRAKAADVEKRKGEAIGTLSDDLGKAEDAAYELRYSKEAQQ